MNKQLTQEKIDSIRHKAQVRWDTAHLKANDMQRELDNLVEPRAGRVMSVNELVEGQTVYRLNMLTGPEGFAYVKCKIAMAAILHGRLFHDADTCNKFGEYLKLEQELRLAQIADGGVPECGGYCIIIRDNGRDIGVYCLESGFSHEKVQFNSGRARNYFKKFDRVSYELPRHKKAT